MLARVHPPFRSILAIAATLLLSASFGSRSGRAECTTATLPTSVVEQQVTTRNAISAPSVAMDNCGRFIVGFQDRSTAGMAQIDVYFLRHEADTTSKPYSGDNDGSKLSAPQPSCYLIEEVTRNQIISVAMGPATQPSSFPPVYATWTSAFNGAHGDVGGRSFRLRQPPSTSTWTFDQATKPAAVYITSCQPNGANPWNSASISSVESLKRVSAWTVSAKINGVDDPGLLAEVATTQQVRADDTFADKYSPCIATRSTGESVIAWAEPERPSDPNSPTDIFLAQFDANGAVVPAAGSNSIGVRAHSQDPADVDASQRSPAIAFVGDDIVVVWAGPQNAYCPSPTRIYARRFRWGGNQVPAVQPIAQGPEFAVDSDTFAAIDKVVPARPTVSLTTSTQPADQGKFFVAWNSTPSVTSSNAEIRGRYLNADGSPATGEFTVNQTSATTQPTEPDGITSIYYLAQSGQHTAVYGPDKQVVCAYTAGISQARGAYFTYLPPSFAATVPAECVPGDVNGDGVANGADIQLYLAYRASGIPTNVSTAEQARIGCAMDCDRNGLIDDCDIPVFVWLLLKMPTTGDYVGNCDRNCYPDFMDIARLIYPGTNCVPASLACPCDQNDDPRCCFCSLIPIPPSEFSFRDCNENEIDDRTDIANETSADCNLNDWPDECEPDCNQNGVPDDCDVDPTDPDGDEVVYPDCNNSSLPDECDFELPLNPSYDCNENGIPDECDIASEFSEDADENGIPDECEDEFMLGMMAGSQQGGSEFDEAAAWQAFYEWQIEQQATLSNMSHVGRFEATRDKLRELGLPEAIPWARVRTP